MTTRTLTTTGTARRDSQPDLAQIEITATGEGNEPADARTMARDRAETIRDSIAVSTDHIQTATIEVEETDEMFGADVEADYYAKERLQVECLPADAEDVVMNVTTAGGTVQNVEFGLHSDAHQQLQDEALEAALHRAREKAERLAAAEEKTIADIQTISTTEIATGMDSIVDEALTGAADTGFAPVPVEVTKTVEVVYELTDR